MANSYSWVTIGNWDGPRKDNSFPPGQGLRGTVHSHFIGPLGDCHRKNGHM